MHKLSGGAADSLQDTFSAKEQSTGFRQSKTPKPMQVLRAVALSRAGRREWVSGRERKPCSDGVSSLSLKEKEFKGYRPLARVRRTVPL